MSLLILDTETTSNKEPFEAIEIAYQEYQTMENLEQRFYETGGFCARFLPNIPIEIGASATHHIFREDLLGLPPPERFCLPSETKYLLGHNIDFDWKVLREPKVKRICTLAMARRLLPELETHTLSALYVYYLGSDAKVLLNSAHSAATDVEICRIVLSYLLLMLPDKAKMSFEALWEYSESCRIPITMPFGKHKGELIKDIPSGYRNWLLAQPELDPYLEKALRNPI